MNVPKQRWFMFAGIVLAFVGGILLGGWVVFHYTKAALAVSEASEISNLVMVLRAIRSQGESRATELLEHRLSLRIAAVMRTHEIRNNSPLSNTLSTAKQYRTAHPHRVGDDLIDSAVKEALDEIK